MSYSEISLLLQSIREREEGLHLDGDHTNTYEESVMSILNLEDRS